MTMIMLFEKLKQIGISCAIATLFPLTVHYAIHLIKDEPTFKFSKAEELAALVKEGNETHDGSLVVPIEIKTAQGTFSWHAKFSGNDNNVAEIREKERAKSARSKELWREQEAETNEWSSTVRYQYDRIYFIIAILVGLLGLFIGLMMRAGSVGLGLLFGGLFTIMNGYFHFWTNMSPLIKFLALLIPILAIIYWGIVSYTKLERE
jgi:hypothetical protein